MIFDLQDKERSDWDQMEMALWGLSNAAVYATLCNYAQIGPQSLKSGNGVIMCRRLKVFGSSSQVVKSPALQKSYVFCPTLEASGSPGSSFKWFS